MVNRVILVGNLGNDVEMKYTQTGTAIANFSLATSEKFKNSEGEKQETTEWHKIVCFKQLAENAGKFLTKGSSIYLEGKIKTRKWQDSDGNDKYITEIIASDIKFLPKNN